jgi:hypothetical protein
MYVQIGPDASELIVWKLKMFTFNREPALASPDVNTRFHRSSVVYFNRCTDPSRVAVEWPYACPPPERDIWRFQSPTIQNHEELHLNRN